MQPFTIIQNSYTHNIAAFTKYTNKMDMSIYKKQNKQKKSNAPRVSVNGHLFKSDLYDHTLNTKYYKHVLKS